MFFGYYPVVEHEVRANGDKIRIYDPMGKEAILFHQADDGDPESIGSAFVAETRKWFDSVWTSIATEVHQVKDAAALLAAANAVLLDFDSPVTPLMPSPINAQAADAARAALHQHGILVPENIGTTTDHLAVVRWAGDHAPSVLAYVEAACLAAELDAAQTCVPTPGAHELLSELHRDAKPVVIVSNNDSDAIRAYLDRHQLAGLVVGVVGRPAERADLMKPNTHPVAEALRMLGVVPTSAVLIGDSVSDVEVAHATHVRSIGYAKTARRGDELAAAGADAITSPIGELVVGNEPSNAY